MKPTRANIERLVLAVRQGDEQAYNDLKQICGSMHADYARTACLHWTDIVDTIRWAMINHR